MVKRPKRLVNWWHKLSAKRRQLLSTRAEQDYTQRLGRRAIRWTLHQDRGQSPPRHLAEPLGWDYVRARTGEVRQAHRS